MKLLVGGDSFAEFPKQSYDTEITEDFKDYPDSPKGKGFRQDLNYNHWCQLLDHDAVSVGIGGADISITTLVTIQQLMTLEFTHCIFFVTDFYRDVIEINKKQPIESAEFAQQTDFDTIYKNKKYIENIDWSSFKDDEADNTNEKVYKKLRSAIWHEPEDFTGKHRPGIMQYLRYHADFKYIHDRLSNLMFLKKYCDDNYINLCFVLPFWPLESAQGVIDYISTEHFHYKFKNTDTEFFKWARTHHTEQEHIDIARQFRKEYSYWLNK